MSDKFSPTLRLGDLNDFIAPSQACVVSLKGSKKPLDKKPDRPQVVLTPKQQLEPVKISLKDCLACSGCITSAETVMLEKQSLDEFLSALTKGKDVIVSLSPQSRASIAVHYDISPLQVFKKLTTFLKSLGVKAVFDTSCSRDLVLIEACNEFVNRFKQASSDDGENAQSPLPILSSACPGWICYAEKTLGSFVLPYVSSVKSPQQAIGTAIKHHLCQALGLRLEEIYHVTVMPCYDKKLEAARDDFVFGDNLTEVDSVLTTGEILDLLKLKGVDFKDLEESPLDRLLTNVTEEGHLYGVAGSSGGYAETIFRHAATALFGHTIAGPLEFKTLRNSDFRELTLELEGKTVLKFATCYGFQNLQNIVRKLKTRKCGYQYVEIMACPAGCLNGGGQIKPKTGQTPKELINSLEATYMNDTALSTDPFQNPIAKRLYDEWLHEPGSGEAKKYLHTQYHAVVKSVTAQLNNW
ncbi:PREDICTED: protein NAR1 [Brassica oleracea var. oleracea]|uniref:protein NAR1 n=1 Tax=Brassica oleracea var. oleracea TaxID=109376 RepID=UPI0006A6E3F9|nr:PREDICTED: protein NAR1 [Brassica oleracea var. oleracea]